MKYDAGFDPWLDGEDDYDPGMPPEWQCDTCRIAISAEDRWERTPPGQRRQLDRRREDLTDEERAAIPF
jgi:hypothetical protein